MSTDATENPPYRDAVGIHARHLLTCRTLWCDWQRPEAPARRGPRPARRRRTLWCDWQRPEAGFGLAGIYAHVEPPEGATFPQMFSRFFVYFQLWGDPGEYQLRIRLVRLAAEGDTGEEEIQLGEEGEPREFPGRDKPPVTVLVSGLNFVEEFALPIGPVPFPESGVYEYQLWVEGVDEPIAREQVQARGFNDE